MDNIFTFFPGYVTKTPAFCLFKLDHDRPRSPGTTVVIVRAASERLTYIQRKCVGRCNKPNNLFWSETLTRTKALLRHALAGQGETNPTIPTQPVCSSPYVSRYSTRAARPPMLTTVAPRRSTQTVQSSKQKSRCLVCVARKEREDVVHQALLRQAGIAGLMTPRINLTRGIGCVSVSKWRPK